MRKLPRNLHHKHGRYYFVARVDGRVKWTPLSTDYAEALAEWAAITGEKAKPARTVGELLQHYLSHFASKVARGERKQATLAGYQVSAARLAPFHGMALEALRPPHVFEYLQRSARTQANRDIAMLSVAYKLANALGWLKVAGYNPCTNVPRNAEKARDRYVTDEEMAALCAKLSPKLRAMVVLAYATALRPADLRALRWSQVSEEGITVKPSKRGKDTLYKMTEARRAAIDAAKAANRGSTTPSMLVFPGKDGQQYTRTGLSCTIRAAVARAKLKDIRLHDIRRKKGSDLPLEDAVKLLGHSDPRVTIRHYRARPRVV